MTDNRTTELLKEFADQFSDAYPSSDIVSEYAERIEQAIAATLGSEREIKLSDALNEVAEKWARARVEAQSCAKRCILLEELVRDLIPFVCADDGIDGIEARMKALGIEVIDE